MHPMFIAVLFIKAQIGKQPKCTSVDEWVKNTCHAHTHTHTHTYTHTHAHSGILFRYKKRNLAICDNMDGPSCYAK